MHWGVRPQCCPAASCGDSRRTKGALGENWLAVATWWLFIVILDIHGYPMYASRWGSLNSWVLLPRSPSLRLVRHMQAGNRPGTAETRGFLTGESSPFVMDLVQTFMADACFRPHAESNKFSRTPTKCFAYERVSSLISMSKRTYSWFSTYFLHIFYFWPASFLHFFPNALLCCCAFQEPTSWTTGMCSTATVVWFKWLWMVVNGS